MTITAVCLPDRAPSRPTCLGCDRRPALPQALTCAGCARALREHLDTIRDGHARLPAHVAPGSSGTGGGGRGAPGFGSRSPARDDVLALLVAPRALSGPLSRSVSGVTALRTDPDAGRNTPAHGAPPLLGVVGAWADQAREDELLPPLRGPRTVAGECLRLSGVLDALLGRWWVGDMLAELRRAAARVRRALGEDDAPTVPIGHCPQPDERGAPCGGEVRARGFGHCARCRACGHRWEGAAAVHELGAQLGDALLDLAALARYLDVPSVPRLRQWAHRDQWTRERVGGRTLYSLADARTSAARAWERAHPLHGPALPPDWTAAGQDASVAA